MTEDRQGFLWLATSTGVYKYDGYRYTSYLHQPKSPNSLTNNNPTNNNYECIMIDRAGYVWLAPRISGVDRLDPATGALTHFRLNKNDPGSLINDTVSVILQDRDGEIWIGTYGGLEKFEPKTKQFVHYRNMANDDSSLSCNDVRALYEDKNGTIWVGTGNAFVTNPEHPGGLNKLNKKTGKFTRYLHDDKDPNSLIDNRVRTIFEDSRGAFWVGTAGDGLHTMDRTNGKFERHLYDPSHPDKLSRPPVRSHDLYADDHITFIIEDGKHRIWIGTHLSGINVYDPSTQKVSYYGADKNSSEELKDNHFWTAHKTKDNTLWIGTWEGKVYKINAYQGRLVHKRTGNVVLCFAEDDANGLWMGTFNGLVHEDNYGKEEKYLISRNASSGPDTIFLIAKVENKFWTMSNRGLNSFDPNTKTFSGFHHDNSGANGLISDTVLYVYKSGDSLVWIGTSNGLQVVDTKAGAWTLFQNNPKDSESISSNIILPITADKNQNIWVGTVAGLNRLIKKTGNLRDILVRLVSGGW